tara:strand:- start:208 stop:627 length:420 start_codon:yes stop_codon:yes gene_type:complete
MYSLEDLYSQAIKDNEAISSLLPFGYSVINYGVKLQKFSSKIEILNCGRNGDYFQECNEEEYDLFYKYGWREGGLRLSLLNCKRKLDLIEDKIRTEVNTRKNDKHIQKLKNRREELLIKYSSKQKQLNQITNGQEQEHL